MLAADALARGLDRRRLPATAPVGARSRPRLDGPTATFLLRDAIRLRARRCARPAWPTDLGAVHRLRARPAARRPRRPRRGQGRRRGLLRPAPRGPRRSTTSSSTGSGGAGRSPARWPAAAARATRRRPTRRRRAGPGGPQSEAARRARSGDAPDGRRRARRPTTTADRRHRRPTPTARARSLRHRDFDRMTAVRAARGGAPHRPARAAVSRRGGPGARSSTGTAGARAPGSCSGATWRPAATRSTWVWRRPARRPRPLVAASATSAARWSATPASCCASARPWPASDGADRGVRLRHAPDAGDPPAARPRPRPGPHAGRGRRSPTGPAARASASRSASSTSAGRAASCARSGIVVVVSDGWDRGSAELVAQRDGPPAAELPPPGLAESAGRRGRLPAAGGRHGRRLPVPRRLPAGQRPGQPGAAGRAADRRPPSAAARPPHPRRPRDTGRPAGRGRRDRARP